MLQRIKELSEKFLKESEGKKILIISHHDTDGITSASILASCLQKLDRNFSIRIVKQLEKEYIKELPKDRILFFLDLGSAAIKELEELENKVYILDHHETENIPKKVNIVNPCLNEEEKLCGACLTYLFAKEIDEENTSLANLAIIGMVGDMMDKNIGKIGNTIINDADMIIKKGLLLYPATRPINKTLEYSSALFIPGVTGSGTGALNMLRDIGIGTKDGRYKSLIELDEEEMSKLITAIVLRTNKREVSEFIGNIFLVKILNKLEDAREMSAMINACSRLGKSHVALSLCMNSREARKNAEEVYVKYKQHLVQGLNIVAELDKIEGENYIIINAKNTIKDTIIGTIASILSVSCTYKEGTAIIAMAHNEEKIKVSARIAGRNGKNIREILDSVVEEVGGESGGHAMAAGCLIHKEKEQDFIEALKKKLEIELIKV